MDTFAIDVSSTCMKVPNARATAVSALRLPARGAGSATATAALTAA
jgi:hypothetical protein